MLKLSKAQISKLKKQGRIKTNATAQNNDSSTNVSGRIKVEEYSENLVFICHLDIEPQSKQRARTFMDKTVVARIFSQAKGNLKKFMALLSSNPVMKTVTPDETRNFERLLGLEARRIMSGLKMEPFSCPVEMLIRVRIKGDKDYWPVASADGDLDNHEKAIKDSLNDIVYTDDRLVVRKITDMICSDKSGIDILVRKAHHEIAPLTW